MGVWQNVVWWCVALVRRRELDRRRGIAITSVANSVPLWSAILSKTKNTKSLMAVEWRLAKKSSREAVRFRSVINSSWQNDLGLLMQIASP